MRIPKDVTPESMSAMAVKVAKVLDAEGIRATPENCLSIFVMATQMLLGLGMSMSSIGELLAIIGKHHDADPDSSMLMQFDDSVKH